MFQVNLVEPLLLGFAFCLYATVSLEQQLIYRKTCVQQFNSTYCEILYKTKNETFKGDQDFVQKKTSQWVIYNSIVRAVPSIVTTLMLTVKFDRIGRKRIMILPIIGGIIVTINYILNAHYMEWPVAWMLIGVFLDASFGQYPALLAAVFAYLADTTSNENRTIRTIILESMLFIGGLISEITSGLLLQYYGFFPPFILVLSVYVCLFVYWFFLKESYPPSENKEQRSFCQELKSKLVNEAYRIIFKQPQKFATRRIVVLLTCFIFSFFSKFFFKLKDDTFHNLAGENFFIFSLNYVFFFNSNGRTISSDNPLYSPFTNQLLARKYRILHCRDIGDKGVGHLASQLFLSLSNEMAR